VRLNVPEAHLLLRLVIDVPIGTIIYFCALYLMQEQYVGEAITQMKGRFTRA